jgi:hypothetical protein
MLSRKRLQKGGYMARRAGPNESFTVLDKRRTAVLKRIAGTGPFIMASPVYVKVRCGNPKCKCSKDKAARHTKLHLTWADSEGTGTQYVPVALRKEVLDWVENYWRVKEHMKDMTALSRRMIHLYARTQKRTSQKKA